jgi:hypothetical protein
MRNVLVSKMGTIFIKRKKVLEWSSFLFHMRSLLFPFDGLTTIYCWYNRSVTELTLNILHGTARNHWSFYFTRYSLYEARISDTGLFCHAEVLCTIRPGLHVKQGTVGYIPNDSLLALSPCIMSLSRRFGRTWLNLIHPPEPLSATVNMKTARSSETSEQSYNSLKPTKPLFEERPPWKSECV